MLHININNSENYILEDFNKEIFFSKIKYFLLIINDVTWKCWIYFLKKKSDFFDILIFFNYLKNLDIQFSAVLKLNWADEIFSIRIQKLLKNNKMKWELSALYIQHQNEIFKYSIQIICRQNKTIMIQTKLLKKAWTKIINNMIFLTNISLTLTEFFSELIKLIKKIETFWKTWKSISYNFQKNIWEIDANTYI